MDGSIWCDYIDMLRHAGKDIRNAHYVCPANLKEAHDKLVEKRNKENHQEKVHPSRNALIHYGTTFGTNVANLVTLILR